MATPTQVAAQSINCGSIIDLDDVDLIIALQAGQTVGIDGGGHPQFVVQHLARMYLGTAFDQ